MHLDWTFILSRLHVLHPGTLKSCIFCFQIVQRALTAEERLRPGSLGELRPAAVKTIASEPCGFVSPHCVKTSLYACFVSRQMIIIYIHSTQNVHRDKITKPIQNGRSVTETKLTSSSAIAERPRCRVG